MPSTQVLSIAQAFVPERPLLVHHVARMLDMCETAVRWNARHGYLIGFREIDTPKIWRFRRCDVEAFAARRRQCANA